MEAGGELNIKNYSTSFISFSELELTGHGSCEITNTLSKLKFIKADTHYRHGLPFFGQVQYFFNIIIIWGLWS